MPDPGDLRIAVKPYEKPIVAMSLFQLVSSIGLFVGAIVLSVGYKLFLAWIEPNGAESSNIADAQKAKGLGSRFASHRTCLAS